MHHEHRPRPAGRGGQRCVAGASTEGRISVSAELLQLLWPGQHIDAGEGDDLHDLPGRSGGILPGNGVRAGCRSAHGFGCPTVPARRLPRALDGPIPRASTKRKFWSVLRAQVGVLSSGSTWAPIALAPPLWVARARGGVPRRIGAGGCAAGTFHVIAGCMWCLHVARPACVGSASGCCLECPAHLGHAAR
jgi:hypothetical protein